MEFALYFKPLFLQRSTWRAYDNQDRSWCSNCTFV